MDEEIICQSNAAWCVTYGRLEIWNGDLLFHKKSLAPYNCNKMRHYSLSMVVLPRERIWTTTKPPQMLASNQLKRLCRVLKYRHSLARYTACSSEATFESVTARTNVRWFSSICTLNYTKIKIHLDGIKKMLYNNIWRRNLYLQLCID